MMKKHILIIDDDQDTLDIIKEVLFDAGYTVTTLTEIENIIEVVAKYKPDLVILDFLLQGINGGELCSQIKKNDRTHLTPVIMMSAHSRIIGSFEIFGCDDFIEKPFDNCCLVEHVTHLLKRGKSRPRHMHYVKISTERNN
ncbi:MAG: response regulator [Bacteroidetes bacterium]|nr:response regulator [Bacteroidota bacterium]